MEYYKYMYIWPYIYITSKNYGTDYCIHSIVHDIHVEP